MPFAWVKTTPVQPYASYRRNDWSKDGVCFLDGDYMHSAGKKVLCHQSQYYIDFYYSDISISSPFVPHDTGFISSEECVADLKINFEQAVRCFLVCQIPLNP